jgi:branched-chain amino acid transport system ATP-binding protein
MSLAYLEINDLHAWYGESHVLHGINLSVAKGEVVCLLGRNGAGRTTTLRAVLGLTGQRKGEIKVNGKSVMNMATHEVAQLGIGYCPEERGIFTSLTCEQNLLLPPKVGEGKGLELTEIYEMFPNLLERCNSPGGRFFGGE